jgi:hypothetical protein
MGCAMLRESYVGERGAGGIYITPYRLQFNTSYGRYGTR